VTPHWNRRRSGAWIRPWRRYAIYARDAITCCWCGLVVAAENRTLDHLVDGTHASHLLVTACRSCNSARKNRGVAAWLRFLRDARGAPLAEVLLRLRRRHVPLSRGRGLLDAALVKHVEPTTAEERPWFDEGGVLY
jgi:hypothetical protein